MPDITLDVHRAWTDDPDDVEGQERLHRERARALHQIADELNLKVEDWSNVDGEHHEIVELIMVGISSGAFAQLVKALRDHMDRGVLRNVEMEHDGRKLSLGKGTREDAEELWDLLNMDSNASS